MVTAKGKEGKTRSCHSLVNRMSDASFSLFCVCVRARAFVSTFYGFSKHLPTAFICGRTTFTHMITKWLKFEVAGVMAITTDMRMLWGNTVKEVFGLIS